MADKYSTYQQLIESNKIGIDYDIIKTDRNSDVTIIAIHGGGIEGGTTEMAELIATEGHYNLFSFMAIRNNSLDCPENEELHVTATKFLNEDCLSLVKKSSKTISLHGCDEEEELSYIGGRDTELVNKIKAELKSNGFHVNDEIREGLGGVSEKNICNKNSKKAGVQIEMSKGLRKILFGDNWKLFEGRQDFVKNEKLFLYIQSIQNALK